MKITPGIIVLFVAHTLSAQTEKSTKMSNGELRALASRLAHRHVIADAHVDFPTTLYEHHFQKQNDDGILLSSPKGNFDLTRAKRGGLSCPFMSIYVPASWQKKPDYGKAFTDTLIDIVRKIVIKLPDKYALANSPADVKKNFKAGKISLPMGLENGAPIGKDMHNVQYFFDRGIRYITLTHFKDNQFCDSSGDTSATWNGLSPLGRELIKKMNKTGMMVDISHVSDSTFYQVLRMTNVPVIASHSSCRFYTPSFKRNMSDQMIKALGKNGGVINISFGSAFLDSLTGVTSARNNRLLRKILSEKKLSVKDPQAKILIDEFNKQHPYHFANVTDVVKHIVHVVDMIGIDHVGFGSDFDGVEDSLPVELKDVSMYPNIIYGLLQKGYSEADIEKICGGNLLRIWQQVLDARL